MWKFAAKRFLIMIPALWLLASVVFLLSRSVPGTAAELQAEEAQQTNNSVKAALRQKALRQQIHRTGQDLPLFYFRVGAASEPDTLMKIFPETERRAMQQLTLTYGDWPQISGYYRKLQQLRTSLSKTSLPTVELKDAIFYTNKLLITGNPETIRQTFSLLKAALSTNSNLPTNKAVLETEAAYQKVVSEQTPELNFQPKLFWFGAANQYHKWLVRLLHFDLGTSYRDARPVTALISEALGITFWLALASFIPVSLLAPLIGMVLSKKSKRIFRPVVLNTFYLLESIPLFVIALVLLGLVSNSGLLPEFPEETALGTAVFCLVLVNLPYLASQSYAALQKELGQQYALTAQAKGFSETQVLRRHTLRNSLLPLITALSELFPALIAGTLVLETIFSLPGIGRLLVSSVLARDYDVITGLVLLIGFVKIISHLLADLLYAIADPRIRFNA
jgi:peptide/nickel transport system permease protein